MTCKLHGNEIDFHLALFLYHRKSSAHHPHPPMHLKISSYLAYDTWRHLNLCMVVLHVLEDHNSFSTSRNCSSFYLQKSFIV